MCFGYGICGSASRCKGIVAPRAPFGGGTAHDPLLQVGSIAKMYGARESGARMCPLTLSGEVMASSGKAGRGSRPC